MWKTTRAGIKIGNRTVNNNNNNNSSLSSRLFKFLMVLMLKTDIEDSWHEDWHPESSCVNSNRRCAKNSIIIKYNFTVFNVEDAKKKKKKKTGRDNLSQNRYGAPTDPNSKWNSIFINIYNYDILYDILYDIFL